MRKFILLLVLLLSGWDAGLAQDITPYIALIERGQVDSVRAGYEDLAFKYPGSVSIRYLRALIETDATKAVAIYKDILRNHANSEFGAPALMYLGEYYYAQGLFIQSQSILKQLIRKYPNFRRLDFAVNLMLRGEIVAGAVDSARNDLSWIRGIRPDLVIDIPLELKDPQPMHEAALELVELKSEQKAEETPVDIRPANRLGSQSTYQISSHQTPAKFELQCGAFGSDQNANILAGQIRSLGYETSITKKQLAGRTLHVVMAGKFFAREQADTEAINIQNALGIGKPFPVIINP